MEPLAHSIEANGFAIVPDVLTPEDIELLLSEIETVAAGEGVRSRADSTFGIRNLLTLVPAVRDIAGRYAVRACVEPILGKAASAVRGIFFDKTPDANWKVPWHQDLSIAVRERRDVDGFGPWSVKAGIPHVQPPVSVLEQILAVRLHLDETTAENGALRAISGSHRHGRLSAEEAHRWRSEGSVTTCAVPLGGALIMRPLLLHASSVATLPSHRRVVHLEYAGCDLPGGLQWHVG